MKIRETSFGLEASRKERAKIGPGTEFAGLVIRHN